MKFIIIFGLFLLVSSTQVKAQEPNIGLTVGDSLPVFNIPNVIHSQQKSVSTKDYMNKLFIIDFWSISCSNCVEALPAMEALERKIGSRLSILPVTFDPEKTAIEFLKHNKYTKNLRGPFVVADKIFHRYFKHRDIPHEIWIYKGKIIAVTSLEYVDEYNIRKVLNHEPINWPIKNDFYSARLQTPLFTLDSGLKGSHAGSVYYSAICDFRKRNNSTLNGSGGSGIVRDQSKHTIRTFFLNQGVLTSYISLWLKILGSDFNNFIRPSVSFQPNQVVWEVSDRSKYAYEKKEDEYLANWMMDNAICFESLYPDTGQTDKKVYEMMISDLNRLLGLNVRWEKRTEKVLVVKKKSVKPIPGLVSKESEFYSIFEVFQHFNNQTKNPYLFVETGNDTAKIAFKLNSWTDTINLKKGFEAAGYHLSLEDRTVDKLIFTETDRSRIVDVNMQNSALLKRGKQINLQNPGEEENRIFLGINKQQAGIMQTTSGLQYKILTVGNGKKIPPGSHLQVQYEGRLVNGKIIESTYEQGIPVIVGVNDVIEGWKEALLQMQEDAEWELYIPSSLAYGTHTGHGRFPPNSTLIFKLHVLKIVE